MTNIIGESQIRSPTATTARRQHLKKEPRLEGPKKNTHLTNTTDRAACQIGGYMRKLQRQIKRGFIDRISPGNKPKNKSYAMRTVTDQAEFKQWRQQLAKNARAWQRRYGKNLNTQLV